MPLKLKVVMRSECDGDYNVSGCGEYLSVVVMCCGCYRSLCACACEAHARTSQRTSNELRAHSIIMPCAAVANHHDAGNVRFPFLPLLSYEVTLSNTLEKCDIVS